MIDWQASKILILFHKTNFSLIYRVPLWIFKWKITKFSLDSSGHRKISNFITLGWVPKKSYWDSKMPPSFLNDLVLLIFNFWCQLRGVITFQWVISLRWNFQDNLISNIPFIWKSFIKIWGGSCPSLVHLSWDDPT